MIDSDWSKLKYFTKGETYNGKTCWGDPDKMSLDFLLKLDKYREISGVPFYVHCAYETYGHSKQSQHFGIPCKCVDGHFQVRRLSPLSAFILATRVGFSGIGLYPNSGLWFIHLDDRSLEKGETKKRWVRDDNGSYHSLSGETWWRHLSKLESAYWED